MDRLNSDDAFKFEATWAQRFEPNFARVATRPALARARTFRSVALEKTRENRSNEAIFSLWDVALPCKGMLEEPPQRELRSDLVETEVLRHPSMRKPDFDRLVRHLSNV